MKRLIVWAVRLYPLAWRRRYQKEFEALLEELPGSPQVLFNTLSGALSMQWASLGKFAFVFGLAGSLLAAVFSVEWKEEFSVTGALSLPSPMLQMDQDLRDAVDRALSRETIAAILNQQGLFPELRKTRSTEKVADEVRRKIRVRLRNATGTSSLDISVSSKDRHSGQSIAASLIHEVRGHYKDGMQGRLYLIEKAYPNGSIHWHWTNLLYGLMAGCVMGIAIGFHRQRNVMSL